MNPIIVVVYWCLASTSMDTFNPHQVDAVRKFIAEHPGECHTQQTEMLDEPNLTIQQCKSRAMVAYMPGWLQRNPGKLYLATDCVPYQAERPEPLDLQALKNRVAP
jgi:hypothetical protein